MNIQLNPSYFVCIMHICLTLSKTYCAQNYAGIMDLAMGLGLRNLQLMPGDLMHQVFSNLVCSFWSLIWIHWNHAQEFWNQIKKYADQ